MNLRAVAIFILFTFSIMVFAGDAEKLKLCDAALTACGEVIDAQDAELNILRKDREELAKQLAKANEPPLLPTWAIILITGLVGFEAGRLLK